MSSVIMLMLLLTVFSTVNAFVDLEVLDNVNSLGTTVSGTVADPANGVNNVLTTVTNVVSTPCDDLPYINVPRSELNGTWYYQFGTNSSITDMDCTTWTLNNVNSNIGISEVSGQTSNGTVKIGFFQAGICGGKYGTFRDQDLATGDSTVIVLYFNKPKQLLIYYVCRYSPSNPPVNALYGLTRSRNPPDEDIKLLLEKAVDTNLLPTPPIPVQQAGCVN